MCDRTTTQPVVPVAKPLNAVFFPSLREGKNPGKIKFYANQQYKRTSAA